MPMECDICGKYFVNSQSVGICDDCYKEYLEELEQDKLNDDKCNCTTTHGGRCVHCGEDIIGE